MLGTTSLITTTNASLASATCDLPVWSRGFAWRCCDVAPTSLGVFSPQRRLAAHTMNLGENGDVRWATVDIPEQGIVYVPSADFAAFVTRFQALPNSTRLTVVTGQEDCSVPRELWYGTTGVGGANEPGRYAEACAAEGAANVRPIADDFGPLSSFLSDRRLVRWWVQNYDFEGWTPYSSGLGVEGVTAEQLAKVQPLPIGLDLHTNSLTSPVCDQWSSLQRVRSAAPSFASRESRLLVSFGCAAAEMTIRYDRAAACHWLQGGDGRTSPFSADNASSHVRVLASTARDDFWHAAGEAAFVATPQGHGMDTHRLWEVLALGAVPVVRDSALRKLYADLPVAFVDEWSDLSDEAHVREAMARWRANITARFGAEPFASAAVRDRLDLSWWNRRIREEHNAQLRATAESRNGRAVRGQATLVQRLQPEPDPAAP